jgi:hypothetical protein
MKAPTPGFVERLNAELVSASPSVIAAFEGTECSVSVSFAWFHSPLPIRYFRNTHAASQLFGVLLERHECVHEISKVTATSPVPVFGVPTDTFVTVTSLHDPCRAMKSTHRNASDSRRRFVSFRSPIHLYGMYPFEDISEIGTPGGHA